MKVNCPGRNGKLDASVSVPSPGGATVHSQGAQAPGARTLKDCFSPGGAKEGPMPVPPQRDVVGASGGHLLVGQDLVDGRTPQIPVQGRRGNS